MASSISDFVSDCIFPSDFCEIPPSVTASALWGEISFPFSEIESINIMHPETGIESSVSRTLFPERLGISTLDMAESALPDFDMGFCGIAGIQSYRGGYPQDLYEFAEKRNGFSSDFPSGHPSGDFWAIQGNSLPTVGEPSMKVGRYSVEERKDRILKYLKKRNQRNFNKTIKYACRKTLADRRVRVRGRFARNSELCEEAMAMKSNNNYHEDEQLYYDGDAQIKQNEDDWLQESVASLMYLPYISG